MLNDAIRSRLAQIHHRSAVGPPNRPHWLATPASPTSLEGIVGEPFAAGEECETSSGKHLRLRRRFSGSWPAATDAWRPLERGVSVTSTSHAELEALADCFPQGAMFLDLETCGFAGSPVFLAGLVWQCDGALVLDQLFARNYSEERALLETLWQVAAVNRVLVTFNGKSFDWPMVHDRSTRHHLGRDLRGRDGGQAAPAGGRLGRSDPRPELIHCDLLHHSRRRWKHVLPNCKLQTLERYLCYRSRRDDLSGAQVPLAYHDFVRGGDTRQMAAILRHNALDLMTLVELALKLLPATACA
jgi:uncharacterized protein YprB with RNaseH-like and TPR domain